MSETIRILVVDDEDSVRKRCLRLLAREGYDAIGARTGAAALEIVKNSDCDVVLADIRMPGMDGMQLLNHLKELDFSIEVIMMTGYAAVETAVQAMKSGAYDYLTKPFEMDELLHVIRNVAEKKYLQREMESLQQQLQDRQGERFLIGKSPVMNEVHRFIDKVASVDCNILLLGESGTGKTLVARNIHDRSPRSKHPYVVADCAALSGALLESELFGHVKGAYTGAYSDRKGYFETASNGTIFLDEVGELPLDLQGKLLRAVEENVIFRIGSGQPLKVDLRVIAATNKNLEDLVEARAFREDLAYRLNVVSLKVPPLRDRAEDIPLLVRHFAKKHAVKLGLEKVPVFSDDVLSAMVAYQWPGNVRELENAVQRALVLADNDRVSLHHVLAPKAFGSSSSVRALRARGTDFHEMRNQVVRDFTFGYVEASLRRFQGNVTHTAKALGMRRTSLQRLLKQLGLNAGDFRISVPPE